MYFWNPELWATSSSLERLAGWLVGYLVIEYSWVCGFIRQLHLLLSFKIRDDQIATRTWINSYDDRKKKAVHDIGEIKIESLFLLTIHLCNFSVDVTMVVTETWRWVRYFTTILHEWLLKYNLLILPVLKPSQNWNSIQFQFIGYKTTTASLKTTSWSDVSFCVDEILRVNNSFNFFFLFYERIRLVR